MKKLSIILGYCIFIFVQVLAQNNSKPYITNDMLIDPKLKVLYVGLPNKIIINELEILPSYKIDFVNSYKTEKINQNTFIVYPKNSNVLLKIIDTISSKIIFYDTLQFKNVPDPFPFINGMKGNHRIRITKKELEKIEKIDLKVNDCLWKEEIFIITNFNLSSNSSNIELSSNNAYLTPEQKALIKNLPSKAEVVFDTIKAKEKYSGTGRELPLFIFEIK